MSPWYSLALALLWSGPSLLLMTTTAQAQSTTECTLSDPLDLGNNLFLQQVQDTASGTYTMKLTYTGGHSWIGIGISRDGRGRMAPSDAVIGRAFADDTTNVNYYHLSTDADDASGVQPYSSNTLDGGKTSFIQTTEAGTDISVLEFTQSIDEMQLTAQSTWIFAVGLADNMWGGRHSIHGSFRLALTEGCGGDASNSESILDGVANAGNTAESGITLLDTTPKYQKLWMAHGILLAIGWGICAPLGIGASILREPLKQRLGQANWYQWHFYLNMSAVVLTIIGFLLAVVATAKEGKEHFDDLHHKVGLAVFILVLVQATAGYLRPPAGGGATPPKTADNTTEDTRELGVSDFKSSTMAGGPQGSSDHSEEKEVASEELAPSKQQKQVVEDPTKPAGKPLKRVLWELSHRALGVSLLGLAWWNCTTGIEAQVLNWVDSQDWTGVFWGVTAGISGSIFLLACFTRFQG